MIFGEFARKRLHIVTLVAAAMTLFAAPAASLAQDAAVVPAPVAATAPEAAVDAAAPADAAATTEAPAFEHYGADMIKGQPVDG
ncbi:MAG: hypothetical protein V4647_09595, partial [Pseudomonadota bacterium]